MVAGRHVTDMAFGLFDLRIIPPKGARREENMPPGRGESSFIAPAPAQPIWHWRFFALAMASSLLRHMERQAEVFISSS